MLWLLVMGLVTRATGEYSECALLLSTTARHRGRSLCIRYEDVEEAFHKARHLVGLTTPARETNDISISVLGTAIQETTRILKQRFWLTDEEVEEELTRIDTLRTDIARFCPPHLLSVPCVPEPYRRIDATCNNLKHSSRGTARTPFARLIPPVYGDGIAEPRRSQGQGGLPNPRTVSRMIHSDIGSAHSHTVSLLFPAWGQLLDHDLTLTAETKEPGSRRDVDCCTVGPGRHPNCLPIPIPRDDPFYSPNRQTCMNFARSLAGLRPNCSLGSRVQQNSVTSYIDGNFIYGSSERVARSLRTYKSGHLLTGPPPAPGLKPLLPLKTQQPDDGCLRPNYNDFCFLAGDNRVNEQIALGVFHTLAVREHNNIANKLANINPLWTDEKLYQETRHIMAGLIQHITYNEFLPVLLGQKFLNMYNLSLATDGYSYDYDEEIDASVPSAFATAAFRFGHSLLPRTVQRRSSSHRIIGERRLSEMLQQPFELFRPGAIDEYTLGMASQLSQAMDSSLTLEVTNHLFQIEGSDFGRDLAAINVARAREHGVPGFVSYRRACGLPDMHSWADMLSNIPNSTVTSYLHLYSGAEDVDLWSAGVSEGPAEGSMVGPVFSCIIALTFRKLKKGDRYWYENPTTFTKEQLREIKKYKLSRMICNAGDNIHTIQPLVMLLPDYQTNPRLSCRSREIPDLDLTHWKDWSYYEDTTPPYKRPSTLLSSNSIGYEDASHHNSDTSPHSSTLSHPSNKFSNHHQNDKYNPDHSIKHTTDHYSNKYTPEHSIKHTTDHYNKYTTAHYNNKYSTDRYSDKYTTAHYNHKQTTDRYSDKYTTAHYNNKHTTDSYSDKHTTAHYNNKHTSDSYSDKHTTAHYNNKHTSDSYSDKYTTAHYNNKHTTDSYSDKHTTAHYNNKYTSDRYSDKYTTGHYNNKHTTDSYSNKHTNNHLSHVTDSEHHNEDVDKNKIISFSQLISDLITDKKDTTLQVPDKHGFYSDSLAKAVTLE